MGFYTITIAEVFRPPLLKFAVSIFLLRIGLESAVPILSATQSLRDIIFNALQCESLAIRLALQCCLCRIRTKSTCAATCDTLAIERYVLVNVDAFHNSVEQILLFFITPSEEETRSIGIAIGIENVSGSARDVLYINVVCTRVDIPLEATDIGFAIVGIVGLVSGTVARH